MIVSAFPAALETYGLGPKKDGYIVKLWVDVAHAAEVFKLNAAIERLVNVEFSRGGIVPQASEPQGGGDGFMAFLPELLMGYDDDDE